MIQFTDAGPSRQMRVACYVLMGLAAFGLVWIARVSADDGAQAPAGVSKSVSTVTSKADAMDEAIQVCTGSTDFADMPGMLVSLRSGGQGSRSVIVLFQSEHLAERPAGQPSDLGTHGFNFLSDLLAPGLHVARIQWRAAGGRVCGNDRSLIVLHK